MWRIKQIKREKRVHRARELSAEHEGVDRMYGKSESASKIPSRRNLEWERIQTAGDLIILPGGRKWTTERSFINHSFWWVSVVVWNSGPCVRKYDITPSEFSNLTVGPNTIEATTGRPACADAATLAAATNTLLCKCRCMWFFQLSEFVLDISCTVRLSRLRTAVYLFSERDAQYVGD